METENIVMVFGSNSLFIMPIFEATGKGISLKKKK